MKLRLLISTTLLFATSVAQSQTALMGVHGQALGDKLKYGPDLAFEWVNPNAPKGGVLTMSDMGTFDSLNPFALKNNADTMVSVLVFETLTMRSPSEAFAQYGLLAKSIDVPADGMSITYHLNPKAKWSDGRPLTSSDVEFSFKILMSNKASPNFRMYYADIKSTKVIDPQTIRFDFKTKNRELAMIVGELPILPKHVYGIPGRDFIKSFANMKPVGSGPYLVQSYDFGKQIKFQRNKSWWGAGENFAKGAWNFDEIHVKYYKDPNAAMEGFKAGDFDFRFEYSSRAWNVDHTGEKWDKNWIRKELWEHHNNQGAQGFAMNLRRPLFKDRLTRKALALAFDFDWANETLFFKAYKPSSSLFNNSDFNATGLPDAKELAILNPLKDKLPPEVFTESKGPLGAGLTGKQRLGEAMKLLKQAGWELKDGVLVNKEGQKLEFTFALADGIMQRVVDPLAQSLAKIGVKMNVKLEDQANLLKRMEKFDFDMVSFIIGQSESLGNEQRDYWHSSSANASESRNIAGIADPAIDVLVEGVIAAQSREQLITASKALDRVLWFTYFHIPNWYMAADRVSYWNRMSVADKKPEHIYAPAMFYEYGWRDAEKIKKLEQAMATKSKMP